MLYQLLPLMAMNYHVYKSNYCLAKKLQIFTSWSNSLVPKGMDLYLPRPKLRILEREGDMDAVIGGFSYFTAVICMV